MNPFRYRGYYLDTETNLYYLQSRYYDSYVGRFINADGQLNGGLLGNNMFAYCENNPVMRTDPNGNGWFGAIAGAICGTLVGAAYGALNALVTGSNMGESVLESAAIGLISGAITGCVAEDIATGLVTSVSSAAVFVAITNFATGIVVDELTQVASDAFQGKEITVDLPRAVQSGVECSLISTISLIVPGGGKIETIVNTTMYDMISSTIQFGVHCIQEAIKQQNERLKNPGSTTVPVYAN